MSEPDSSAVRTALWRALHVERDAPPHVFDDVIGLKLAAPPEGWRARGDMQEYTRSFRAAIVSRARFVEELVVGEAARGVEQYVLLGAGLDTFGLRRRELAAQLDVYEIDQPGPQAWKRERMADLSIDAPTRLRFVPVDFEAGDSWWDELAAAGFDAGRRAVIASTGVSMYLTEEATVTTLRRVARLPAGSTLAMTVLLPTELVAAADRPGYEAAQQGAQRSGTPFVSFYAPDAMLELARGAGFARVEHVSADDLAARYFAGRADGLRPSTGEDFLVATT